MKVLGISAGTNGGSNDCFLYSRMDLKSVLFIFSVSLLICLFSISEFSYYTKFRL